MDFCSWFSLQFGREKSVTPNNEIDSQLHLHSIQWQATIYTQS